MKILKIIFRLPLLPFIFLFILYVIIKIYQNTNIVEIALKEENDEQFLSDDFKNYYNIQFKKYNTHINTINLILWLMLIMYVK